MSAGQMITIALCISMYFGVDKGPNKYGLLADLAHGPPFEKAWIKPSQQANLAGLCVLFVKGIFHQSIVRCDKMETSPIPTSKSPYL